MRAEVREVLSECPWYRVYDIIESFYVTLKDSKDEFEKDINEYFVEKGIGWKLEKGIIEVRGSDIYEQCLNETETVLANEQLVTSLGEVRESRKDLSKRPDPDITGSIQHSIAALECLCREISGDKKPTLGALMKRNPGILPRPIDNVVEEIYGFASEHGRHLREGEAPKYEEAEFVAGLSMVLCIYLAKKNSSSPDDSVDF